MREKPLVLIVTDAHIQTNRGEVGCDSITRWNETVKAMNMLDTTVFRLGIPDYDLSYHFFANFLKASFGNIDVVYAPAIQGGSPHHDIVSRAAHAIFGDKVVEYSTYGGGEFFSKGEIEIVPTEEEYELKKKALECYASQRNLPSTKRHFDDAIAAKSEWQMKPFKHPTQ